MSVANIRIFEWPLRNNQCGSSQHALFNSGALAEAGRLNGYQPFCISIEGNRYLASIRHASAVIGGLSLNDMSVVLSNLSLVKDSLVAMGIRSISLSSWNAENNPGFLYQLLNQQCQMRFEFLLDTEQYSISKISSNHKRNIKKSEKAGAQITLPVDIEAMRSHIELVNHNLSAKGVGGITHSPEYFQFLIDQDAGLLMQVSVSGQLRASTFFYTNKDYSYYHSAGTDETGKKVGAAHFLVDCMIAEMRKRDIRFLNLGGCTAEQTGLYRFKLGFRPETRILLSAKRRLISTTKGKLRSLMAIRPKDILKTASVHVFVKSEMERTLDNKSDYLFRKLCFDKLFDAVASNLELAPYLALFGRSQAEFCCLYDGKGQLIALGSINSPEANRQLADKGHNPAADLAEIGDIYVLQEMRSRGIGATLLVHLEVEANKRGCSRVYSRIDAHNVAAQKLFLTRGFYKIGEEMLVSTALMQGKQRIIGKIEI